MDIAERIQREMERRRTENQTPSQSPVTTMVTDTGPEVDVSDINIPAPPPESEPPQREQEVPQMPGRGQRQQDSQDAGRGGFNPLANPISSFEDQAAEQARQELERRKREERNERLGNISSDTRYQRNNLYGPRPEKPGIGTRAGAVVGDVIDAAIPGRQESSEAQKAVEEFRENEQQYLDEAVQTYEDLGKPIIDATGGMTGRTALIAVPDDNAEGGSRVEEVLLPNPYGNAFYDVFVQTGSSVLQDTGDLATGNVLQEGPVGRAVPDTQLPDGQQLTSDILGFLVPGLGVAKGAKFVGRGVDAIQNSRRARQGDEATTSATRSGAIAGGTTNFGGQAAVGTVFANPDDDPLMANPEYFEDTFKMSPERAQEAAIFAENLLVDGALSALGAAASKVKTWVRNKGSGVFAGINPQYLQNATQRQTVMNTMKYLDPEIDAAGDLETLRNMDTFSRTLGANASLRATLGSETADIPVPTVNSLMKGAENYIRVSRQRLRQSMEPEEYEEYVREEATNLVNRAVGLSQMQSGKGGQVARREGQTTEAIRGLTQSAVRSQAPVNAAGESIPAGQAMRQTTERLAQLRQADVQAADAAVGQAQANVDLAQESLDSVVSDNAIVRDVLNEAPSPDQFLRVGEYDQRLKQLMGETAYNEYVRTFDEVNAAYSAIPNDPLPEENILALQSELNGVVRNANQMDSSGGTAKAILGDVYRAFQPQESLDESGEVIIETTDELLDRLGDIGFQDIYQVKRNLSRTIDGLPDGPVKTRLIDFRNHITDPDRGQIGLLQRSGNDDIADAAVAADQRFKDAMARFNNSEPIKQFSDRAGVVRSVGQTFDDVPGSSPRGRPDLEARSVQDVLPAITNDPTGAYFDQFALALEDVMSRENLSATLGEKVTAEALYSLGRSLRNGDRQSAEQIINTVGQYREQLERFNPQLLDRLDSAASQVRDETVTRQQLVEQSTTILEDAKAAQDRATNGVLSKLISPNSDDIEAISNPMARLKKLMNDDDSGNAFRQLQEQINRITDPQERAFAQRSLKAATLKNATDMLFTTSSDAAVSATEAARRPSRATIRRIQENEANNILNAIDTVFSDDEVMQQTYRTLLASLDAETLPGSISYSKGGSPTASNLSIRDAVSTGILLTAGYMNPTAAAARRLTSESVAAAERQVQQVESETLERILADPEVFAEMVNEVRQFKNGQGDVNLLGNTIRAVQTELRLEDRDYTSESGAKGAVGRMMDLGRGAYNSATGTDETERMLDENEVSP